MALFLTEDFSFFVWKRPVDVFDASLQTDVRIGSDITAAKTMPKDK
jgi:hypothetical protein